MQECVIIVTDTEFNEVQLRMQNLWTAPIHGDFMCFEDGGPVYSVVVRIHGESLKVIVEPTSIDGGPPQSMTAQKAQNLQKLLSKHRYTNQPDLNPPF